MSLKCPLFREMKEAEESALNSARLLQVFIASNADPEELNIALASWVHVIEKENRRKGNSEGLADDLSVDLRFALEWLCKREMGLRGQTVKRNIIKTEPSSEMYDEEKREAPRELKAEKTEKITSPGPGDTVRSDDLREIQQRSKSVSYDGEREKNRGAWSDDAESENDTDDASDAFNNDEDKENRKKKRTTTSSKSNNSTECDECGKYFTTAGTMRVHKLRHLQDEVAKRPYACDQCDKRFTQAGSLSVHKRKHLAEDDPRLLKFKRIWTCETCGKECKNRTSHLLHRKTHLGESNPEEAERRRPHKCQYCDKAFTSIPILEQHERLHTGNLPFSCKLCPRKFNEKTNFDVHMRNHAKGTARVWNEENQRRYGPRHCCTLCPRKFMKNFELAAHMKRHADDTVGFSSDDDGIEVVERTFQCPKCPKVFDTKRKIERHVRSIHGLPFECPHCDRTYKIQSRLAVHLKSDHGVEVEPSERARLQLERYNNAHLQPRPFKCEHCPATFTTQFALDKHKKQHEGPSTFKCSTCGHEFSSFPLLEDHKREQHDPMPYACLHCGKKYKDLEGLTEHKRLRKLMQQTGYSQGCATKQSAAPTKPIVVSTPKEEIVEID